MNMGQSETLILVDLSSIFWTNWHATKDLELNETFDRTTQKVRSYADRGHVIVCIDSPPYKRKDIYPEYKAQRDKPEPTAVEQLKRVQERIEADGFAVVGAKGYEADDVIATLVRAQARRQDDLAPIAIVSADKDLCQLVGDDDVHIWHAMRDEVVTPETVIEKYGVAPLDFVTFLALVGDKSDNVPGCPGVGGKTAAKLIAEFGTVSHIISAAEDTDREARSSVYQKIVDNADAIRMSLDLVRLDSDVPIDLDAAFAKREPKPLTDAADAEFEDDDAPITNHREPEPKPEPKPTALAKAEPTGLASDWTLGLQPNSVANTFILAKKLAESRLYSKFSNEHAIAAVILRGRELGLGALTSLDMFHVIEGRPSMHASLIVGLVKSAHVCEYFQCIESTDELAKYETKRRGDKYPETETFSIKDAERAGYLRPSRSGKPTNWQKDPRVMLTHRCATRLARRVYPDKVGGLYSLDEMSDGVVADAEFEPAGEHPELAPTGAA